MIILNCDQHRNLSFVDKKYRILQGEHKFDVLKINMPESIDGVDDIQSVSIKMYFTSGNEHVDRQVVLENGYISTDIDYTLTEKSKRWLLYLAFYVNVDGEVEIGKTNAVAIQVNKLPYSDTLAKEHKEPEIVLIKGDKGDKGDPGEDGKSAYEIAVEHGYEGTEEEWLSEMKDYNELDNKPRINGHTLSNNQSTDDLGLQGKLTAGDNITIENGTISASGVTSYEDLTDKPNLSIVKDAGDYPIVTETLNNLRFNVDDFLGFIPNFENKVYINLSPFVMKYQNAVARSDDVGQTYYIYDFNGFFQYQNGIFRINENAQYYPARNFPAALNDIDRTKSYFILQAFNPSYASGNASGYMLRKVYGCSSSGECLEFSQIAHIVKHSKGTWKVDSQTDWVELTGGGSQIVSGVVNANGTITFTDSNGNTFTTTGASVIGEDGFSPVATVTQTASGATVSITDSTGTTTANISNGQNGNDYVLTAQDKFDIADIVLSELPTTQGVLYGNTSN